MQVQPEDKANKVKVHGDGIKPQVLASIPEQFTIDCRETGSDKQPVPIIQVGVSFTLLIIELIVHIPDPRTNQIIHRS